jgi:pimeloyl-ACP methyl ester carboxylesterase
MIEAADVALELVTNRLGCDVSKVVLLGKSIGSFPAVSLAARPCCARIQGLVLVSPVASAARCVFDASFVPGFLMQKLDSVALNNLAEICKVQCLVLFIHGRQDKLVPCDNSEVLKEATSYHSQHPALYVDAGHNDIECRHQTLFLSTLRSFVQTCITDLNDKAGATPYEFMHFEGGSG